MPVRYQYQVRLPVLPNKADTKKPLVAIELAMKISLKDWLSTIAGPGGRVPLFTGMARASLFKVAQLSGGTLLLSPLKGASRIGMGKQLGTASLRREGDKVVFKFRSTVPHWQNQESSPGISPSAPWQSLPAAADAFVLRFDEVLKLPKFDFKMTTTTYS